MIKKILADNIKNSLLLCKEQGVLNFLTVPEIEITPPAQAHHGDFSSNIAFLLSSEVKRAPRQIAEEIVTHLDKNDFIEGIEVAGAGFINFRINNSYYFKEIGEILKQGDKYGSSKLGAGKKVQVEFVSANPTGPLHIGHGRGAVFGDALASILSEVGYEVEREYYINDAGNQMSTLGKSVFLRYLEQNGMSVKFPDDCYQGEYIKDIAKEIEKKFISKIEGVGDDAAVEFCAKYAGDKILQEIKDDLKNLGVVHDIYFSEKRLHENKSIESCIKDLRKRDLVYDKEGATWFRSMSFGDDKDRVLIKNDGSTTYFAADIAYHKHKFEKFYKVIDIWGADHAGYVIRTKAAVATLGKAPEQFDIILIQLVNLIRSGQLVSMSTRSATYETLSSVLQEVGRDACRYFFLMRSHNAKLDFDLELAKKQAPENPVYYIQYAHARICSVFKKAEEQGIKHNIKKADISLLDLPEEVSISKLLLEYPNVLKTCAQTLEPHPLSFYLYEVAQHFQSYYTRGMSDPRYRMISENKEYTNSKLYLLKNIQIVIKNGLRVMGICAPERMSKE